MNKSILLLIAFLSTCVINVNAQQNFWNNKDAYLGQTTTGDTPQIFAQ